MWRQCAQGRWGAGNWQGRQILMSKNEEKFEKKKVDRYVGTVIRDGIETHFGGLGRRLGI